MRTYGAVRELAPTEDQSASLCQAVGAVRFAQNWALSFIKEKLENKEEQSWSSISLHTAWRQHRDSIAPWYTENSKETYQYGCERAANALSNWHKSKKGVRKGKRVGFPRFRKRGHNDSVGYSAAKLRDCGTLVRIPRTGDVRLKESYYLPENAQITGIFVRPRAGRWFITFRIRDEPWIEPQKKTVLRVIGVDAGVGDQFAILSSTSAIENPRLYRRLERRLRLTQKSLSRKQKGSANRRKAIQRVQHVHYRIDCQRKDFIHKFTTDLVKSHDEIVIEDLNLHGMKSSHNLGKSVSDVAWAEARRQLTYKSSWYGTTLTVVSQWFPSSKQCHVCDYINYDLKRSDLFWTCLSCGTLHDRNWNAALNLIGQSILAGSSPVSACGDDVRRKAASAVVCETGSVAGDTTLLLAKVSKI
jgi:putative transposase